MLRRLLAFIFAFRFFIAYATADVSMLVFNIAEH